MTTDCITRIKAIADAELSKLVTHLEEADPDRHDIVMLKDLLKIHKCLHDLAAVVK